MPEDDRTFQGDISSDGMKCFLWEFKSRKPVCRDCLVLRHFAASSILNAQVMVLILKFLFVYILNIYRVPVMCQDSCTLKNNNQASLLRNSWFGVGLQPSRMMITTQQDRGVLGALGNYRQEHTYSQLIKPCLKVRIQNFGEGEEAG